MMEYDELEDLLQRDASKKEKYASLVPEIIKVTPGLRKKAESFGPLVRDIGKNAYEWYGYILGDTHDPEYIVRDMILAKDQNISTAYVSVDGAGVAQAAEEVVRINQERGTNYQIIGWIHNHADFHTFHSCTDDNNIITVLNSVSLNTERSSYKLLDLIESKVQQSIEDGKIVINGQNAEDARLEYQLSDLEKIKHVLKTYGINPGDDVSGYALRLLNDLIQSSEFSVKEPKITGFCYSIVVNNHGDEPYGEIAVLEEDVISGKKKTYKKENLGIEVVEVESDIVVDKEELRKEIDEKIEFPKTGWSDIFSGKGKRQKFGYEHPGWKDSVQSRYSYASQARPTKPKKVKKKKLTLQEICHEFVECARRYNIKDSYGSDYIQYLDGVLLRILEGKGLREAVLSSGEATRSRTYRPSLELEDRFNEIIGDLIYERIDSEDEDSEQFMLDFLNSYRTHQTIYKRNGIIEGYVDQVIGELFEDEEIDHLLNEQESEDLPEDEDGIE